MRTDVFNKSDGKAVVSAVWIAAFAAFAALAAGGEAQSIQKSEGDRRFRG